VTPATRARVLALARRWPVVVLSVAAALVTAAAITVTAVPRYTATTVLRLSTPGLLSGDVVRADSTDYFDRLENTYASLAESRELRRAVATHVQLARLPQVHMRLEASSELISIDATTGSARSAVAAANDAAPTLIDDVDRLDRAGLAALDESFSAYAQRRAADVLSAQHEIDRLSAKQDDSDAARARIIGLREQVRAASDSAAEQQTHYEQRRAALQDRSKLLSVVTPANTAKKSYPKPLLNGVLALIVGLAVGLGLILAFELLRNTVDGAEDVEAAGLRVFATILTVGAGLASDAGDGGAVRRLRTELLAAMQERACRALVVTGAISDAGTTDVVTTLGLSLERSGSSVAIIDADVTAPAVHKVFGLKAGAGLAGLLERNLPVDRVLVASSRRLHVLPAGKSATDARELLGPARAGKLLTELEERAEVVLVDTPPAQLDPTAFAFAGAGGVGVVLVVAAGRTKLSSLPAIRRDLAEAGGVVLGAVLTYRAKRHRRSRRTTIDA
jgi:Mrp family chromosome partitioning ATPase/capsular polysaccharide biosynthesis protein